MDPNVEVQVIQGNYGRVLCPTPVLELGSYLILNTTYRHIINGDVPETLDCNVEPHMTVQIFNWSSIPTDLTLLHLSTHPILTVN